MFGSKFPPHFLLWNWIWPCWWLCKCERCSASFLGADVFITNDFVATLQEDIHIPTKLAEAQNVFHVVCTSNKEAWWWHRQLWLFEECTHLAQVAGMAKKEGATIALQPWALCSCADFAASWSHVRHKYDSLLHYLYAPYVVIWIIDMNFCQYVQWPSFLPPLTTFSTTSPTLMHGDGSLLGRVGHQD